MNCHEAQSLLHPFVDGELDALRHVEIEEHLKGCPACAAEQQTLLSLRAALSSPALYYRAPAAFAAQLQLGAQPLNRERRSRAMQFIAKVAALSSLVTAAIILLFLTLRDRQSALDRVADAVVASHIRSLQVDHLEDVVSSEQHTVKPWFRGKLDFSPEVPDFSSQGFVLSGGRLDYLADRTVAAIVYQCRAHVINLFVWPAVGQDTTVRAISRQGYHIRHWQHGGMDYWAISDVNDRDLDQFVQLLQDHDREAGR
jgi:anti-sigma factor RsiW